MVVQPSAWAEYARWNGGVAATFYPESSEGRPVYLDLDDEQFEALAAAAGCKSDDAEQALAAAVRGVLNLHVNEPDVFGPLLHQARFWFSSWRRTQARERLAHEPPPVLALLAVLSRAADLMGADATLAPINYYGRLTQLLQINTPKAQKRLVDQYRHHAEALWKLLEIWLTGLEGLRGLPSAFAVSHRYVGLPMSQALVRGQDRAKLEGVFTDLGLAPGQQMSAEEMERLLDPYLTREDSPLSRTLRRLWTREAARERIASVAAVELESWAGPQAADVDSAGSTGGQARLALLQRSFPVPSLETTVFVRAPGAGAGTEFIVTSAEAAEPPCVSFAEVSGWLRPVQAGGIDVASLLEGVLVLQDSRGRTIRRLPRRVVPLRWDEIAGAFVEVERVTLTEDCVVLSRAETASAVADALANIARQGWSRVDQRPGLPDGWVLFTDVQVLGLLPTGGHVDLNVLIPHVRSQVSLAGGLRLPGGLRKFSALAPPEVRFAVEAADRVTFELTRVVGWSADTTDEPSVATVLRQTVDGAAGVLPLAPLHLPDGDYELTVRPEPSGRLQTYQVRLRSGDTVDAILWSRSPRLVHDLGRHPGWAIMSAEELTQGSELGVDGATSYGDPTEVPPTATPAKDPWWDVRQPVRSGMASRSLKLAQPDPQSCINTGRHRIILPTYYGGRAASRTIEGRCEGCGLVKRYPAWLPRHGKRVERAQRKIDVVVPDVPPVQPGEVSWDAAFDAIMHAGGGPIAALERTALQVKEEASSLFVDQFQRTLQVLGHIDIARDAMTFRPVSWEVTPSALTGLVDDSYQLIGYWPASHRAAVARAVTWFGGHLLAEPQPEAPTRYRIVGCDLDQLEELASNLGFEVAVDPDAGSEILHRLPGVSEVASSLPTVPLPGGRVTRFDISSARWVDAADASAPGSYRLQSFSTWDVIRRDSDIERGTARVATVHLSKHLEGLRMHRPLVAYRPAESQLLVPLGCDLPGLLGRGVTLVSGKLPTAVPSRRALVYHDIPRTVADVVAGLLSA